MPASSPQNVQTWDNSGDINTQSYTVPGSLTDSILVVQLVTRNNTGFVGVTYNGVALTAGPTQSNGAGARVGFFYLVNPPAGAYDLVWTLSANIQGHGTAFYLTGVNQANPIGDFDSTTVAAGTVSSLTLTAAADDLVIDCMAADNSTAVASADGDNTQFSFNTNTGSAGYSSSAPGAASVTMSWTVTVAYDLTHVALVLQTASGGTTYNQSIAGAITPTGSVATEVIPPGLISQSIEGSITPTGDITQFGFGLDTLAGSITPVGTLTAQRSATTETKSIGGGITPTGSVRAYISAFTLAGGITPVGTVATDPVNTYTQSVGGGITPTGNLTALVQSGGSGSTAGATDFNVRVRRRR